MKKNADPLGEYKQKRNFTVTPEPAGMIPQHSAALSFVVQKHAARSLHYDFRLEFEGTMKSWAIPKGPSLDPAQKRLAIHVEDHPISYAAFEGVIPSGQYGAGSVIIWDRGTWEPISDPQEGFDSGQLKFRLHGEKLKGAWALVRMKGKPDERQESWLLIKEHDDMARRESEFSVAPAQPASVADSSEPSLPAGASAGPLPASLAPQLATLVSAVPAGDDWVNEIKFDGYRILTRFEKGDVRLFTRNGKDWTDKLHNLLPPLQALNIDSGWLDGEIVVTGTDGVPDFDSLQRALEADQLDEVQYFVFDIPFYDGFDLREAGLTDRRALLARLLGKSNLDRVRLSEAFAAGGADMLRSACRLGLEGIISKRRNSAYASGRSPNWLKLKCGQRQEFVVVGYTDPQTERGGIGALLLGVTDDAGKLHYAGKVGTGFTAATSRMLKARLEQLATDSTPLIDKPNDAQGLWVKPELVAEVSFREWTRDGRIRHGVFKGLRSDKSPTAIPREIVQEIQTSDAKISNPDRVVDASTGLRKLDLVNYYQFVATWMLPHLVNRPVAFLRAPTGIGGELFFQKHGETLKFKGLTQLDPAIYPGHAALMAIDSVEALISAAQMNVVEFHTWNATTQNIEKPDRVIFDLDPGEGLAWKMMIEAAEIIHIFLGEIGLQNYLKTSGGKGLHIVVPLTPHDDWSTVKGISKTLVEHLAAASPRRFVSKSGPANRVGKIFVDYLRNGRGATSVAAFSARARPGMGISMPCSWQELSLLTGGAQWTIANARQRLEFGEDPWASYVKAEQTLSESIDRLSKIN